MTTCTNVTYSPVGVRFRIWHQIGLTFLVLLATCVCRASSLSLSIEVPETMLAVQEADALFLAGIAGPDGASTLQYTFSENLSSQTFAYATLPGQTYQGLAISMILAGSFDSSTGSYDWTGAGYLGANSWTDRGSGAWVGDPTFPITGTYVYKGVTYDVTGNAEVDSQGHSSGTFTYTNPTTHQSYNWGSTDFVPGTPSGTITIHADGFADFSLNGQLPAGIDGGIGTFSATIAPSPVPEPASLLLVGGAMVLFGRGLRRQRKSHSAKADRG